MPQHKRGPWSQTEDQYLVHLVNLHGAHNWVRISSTIQTRSPKQCRERFHQNLKPNLNHDPITPEEGLMIEQMVAEMGKRWAEIARRLRGRSDNAVKNWWNGGMNRRRRSNNSRRTELEVRQQPQMTVPSLPPPPTHHHPLPPSFPPHGAASHQYFGQPVFHPSQMQQPPPPHFSVPSNGPVYHRHSALIETPLPSPSAFSQMSAEGAPSLMSDCSSVSGRSPHHGPSSIELPPLSGPGSDRRHSSGPLLRLGVAGSFAETDYQHQQPMPMKQPPHVLQEPFQPQHQQFAQQAMFAHPQHFVPSQLRQPRPMQMPVHSAVQQYPMPSNPLLSGYTYQQAQVPSTPAPPMQLPSISKLAVSGRDSHSALPSFPLDPALAGAHNPFEASPKDKMSLSNLTH
ncbi:hypothetical protein LTR36_004083 [Oleoguttula mirabilis]|uniref:Uncharacterized protein n=1 Tax=Oleoguttula mirabilis TaxID=1507867 RepID=A0AAV9JHY7_9PEZI|nr:hypothetical protein LTR36_004083 [Oleoguttula mirabilis]